MKEKSVVAQEKGKIRKEVFAARKAMSDKEWRAKSETILNKIYALPEYQKAECVYAYMDIRHEVRMDEFVMKVIADGKRVAVPKVEGENIVFYYINSFNDLELGSFDVREPKNCTASECEDALFIIPGVAFSRDRMRVGYGGGFYDRYLCKHTKHVVVAPAFSFQIYDKVPTEPTDMPINMIITEKESIC